MSILHEIASDFQEAERDSGDIEVVISGVTYTCVPSAFEVGTEVELGGNLVSVAASIMIRTSLFGSVPTSGAQCVYKGSTYTIALVEDVFGTLTKLTLTDANR